MTKRICQINKEFSVIGDKNAN